MMTKANNSSRSSSTSNDSNNSEDQHCKRIRLDDNKNEPKTTLVNSSSAKTQAAFVNKLYKMLEDPQAVELISWSSRGDLFSVSNPTSFSKYVLPQYFKHNNWQSFVRQLNMYGFHKVNDLIHSNLTNENQTWEFKHPNFKRGAVGDLQNIKRKSAKTQLQQLQQQRQKELQQQEAFKQEEMNKEVLTEGDPMSRIESRLLGVSKSCELLYNEIVHLRMVVSKQQVAMQDLVDVVSTSKLNSNCICSNNNRENAINNQQDLKDAESLRLQVSKLKEIQNINRFSTDHRSNTNHQFDSSEANYKNYSIESTRKLPLIESMSEDSSGERKSSFSSSNSFSSSDCNRQSSFKSNERNHSSFMMGFGKESHILNPSHDSDFHHQ
ncbi:hypothetical protein G6F46_010191 [Rhizopus delemar]|nr:hypothetical protein G6F55_009166 [Rhizopus delemar]KAG1551992.1 hypothetical protein G6F49_008823 [Rhizopus delemar]KAG1610208.1 hypothetical protein G6F46_010191 [Rhizopus delemar]KAG1641231.1 hypothetical protein G6F44_006034 [Rhizopus delemar]